MNLTWDFKLDEYLKNLQKSLDPKLPVHQSLRRLLQPRPGDPAAASFKTLEVEGGWQSTMALDSRCCAKIWPKEGPTKCFVGEICGTKNEAEESAMEKFWQDPDVRKTAATLPPSGRKECRASWWSDHKNSQKASNQLRHHARLEQRRAESALR